MKTTIASNLTLKDLGNAQFILAIEMQYDRQARKLSLNQTQFIRRTIQKYNQTDVKEADNSNEVTTVSVVGWVAGVYRDRHTSRCRVLCVHAEPSSRVAE